MFDICMEWDGGPGGKSSFVNLFWELQFDIFWAQRPFDFKFFWIRKPKLNFIYSETRL
jgi:hypothetical protein